MKKLEFENTVDQDYSPEMRLIWASAGPVAVNLTFLGCISLYLKVHFEQSTLTSHEQILILVNPFALRKAKTVYSFGLSECNKHKEHTFHIIIYVLRTLLCRVHVFLV